MWSINININNSVLWLSIKFQVLRKVIKIHSNLLSSISMTIGSTDSRAYLRPSPKKKLKESRWGSHKCIRFCAFSGTPVLFLALVAAGLVVAGLGMVAGNLFEGVWGGMRRGELGRSYEGTNRNETTQSCARNDPEHRANAISLRSCATFLVTCEVVVAFYCLQHVLLSRLLLCTSHTILLASLVVMPYAHLE